MFEKRVSNSSVLKRERKLGNLNRHPSTAKALCFGHATDVISPLNYTGACFGTFLGIQCFWFNMTVM